MLLIYILVITISMVSLYIQFRRVKNITDYIVLWLLIIILFSPLILYYTDLFDIPTKIGLMKNVDTSKWFDFTTSYMSTIIGTLVSSLIVIITVIKQIEVQNNSSKEDKRIENAPLMKYYLQNEYVETKGQDLILNSEGRVYNIFFGIENIGLNHAKKIEIELNSEEDNWKRKFKIENEQSILKKEEIYWFDFVLNYKKKSKTNKLLKIKILYYDMLNNQYEQMINIDYTISNEIKLESRGIKLYFNQIDIEDERLIK